MQTRKGELMLYVTCIVGLGFVILISSTWFVSNIRSKESSILQKILSGIWVAFLITVFAKILV